MCLAGLSLLTLGIVFVVSDQSSQVNAAMENGKLITVYDRGEKKTFLTDQATIGDALNDADISLDDQDAVEPTASEKLVASEYQVNIYRARPVTVIDGISRKRVVTPYQTVEQIAKDASITLYAEDTAKLSQSSDILTSGAGLEMTIDRAAVVRLDLFGDATEVRTQGETVAALLAEKGVKLTNADRTQPSLGTSITNGSEVRVWREGRQTVTVEEVVAFGVEQIKDADRPIDYKQVQTPGVDGKKRVTYDIEIINGAEVSRTEIASIEIEAAVKQVEVIGSKTNTVPYTGGGTKTEWLAASSIPRESWGYADFMVHKESTWNPNAVNKSSGACGLAQALPCSKLGPEWNNPIVALNWMNSYVNGRYYDGSPYAKGVCAGITDNWECAYTYWQKYRWY